MKGINRKTFFYILCACQIFAILMIVFTYYRNAEWNGQEYRFRCDSKNPFGWKNQRFAYINLDIEEVPADRYTGERALAKGMVIYCTLRDIHGYHQIVSISTKRPSEDIPFMKTRVERLSAEMIHLEINFDRYPLQGVKINKVRDWAVANERVVILGARISKRGTVYAKNLYIGDMQIEDLIKEHHW
jgi:hypothetical protein